MTALITPVARTPLVHWHREHGAKIATVDGWEIAIAYPGDDTPSQNRIADITRRTVTEFTGKRVGATLANLCGREPAIREIVETESHTVCRLADARALAFGETVLGDGSDVTGGWTSLALWGPDVTTLLQKVTAVDVRERTLKAGWCCQGPVFGVNTLFSRFANRVELHACPDMLEFLWEVLLDAGAEFKFEPAGFEAFQKSIGTPSAASPSPPGRGPG